MKARHPHCLIYLFFTAWFLNSTTVCSDDFTEQERLLIQSLTTATEKTPHDASNRYINQRSAKKLGKALFFDTRLSGNGKISCASCHQPKKAFTDGRAIAIGVAKGQRNSPTLINVAWNRWFFWDGRADSLWSQAISPINSRIEMAGNWQVIRSLVFSDPRLSQLFTQAFGDALPLGQNANNQQDMQSFQANIGKALAAFQSDLQQFNSPFDQFARSLHSAEKTQGLSTKATAGLRLFIGKARCILCHSGPNFSDGEFHNIRLPSIATSPQDSGRHGGINAVKASIFNSNGAFSDLSEQQKANNSKLNYLRHTPDAWGSYKTPTLRNIADTAPYMHDGSINTLAEVIEHYSTFANAPKAKHQSGLLTPLNLSTEEKQQLESFLHTLSGTIKVPNYDE